MDKNVSMRVITLKDLWDLFIKRMVVILVAAAVVGGGLLAYNVVTYTPEYSSTATLYILRQDESASSSDVSNDFSLALKVVNDCTYLLKSHSVLDEVIESLSLNMTYEELYDCVSTDNPENTRILEVTVTTTSPEEAKQIVDKLCTIGPEKIDEAMGFAQVNLFEYGTLNQKPSNGRGLANCVVAGVVAAVLTYTVFLVIFLLDDRIHPEDDIEKLLGLSILGDIPNADAPHKDGYGYYVAGRSQKAHASAKKKGGK